MPTLLRGPLCAVLAGASLGLGGLAAAEPAPPFTSLLAQAQTTAPRPAAIRAEVDRAQALARQAGLRPNPTLSLDVENFAGSGPYSGAGMAEVTASVQQTLQLGGKRDARALAGQGDLALARRRATEASLAFAFDLADAYAQAEAAERRLALAAEALSLAEDDARVARALVEAGRDAELRSVQAQAAAQSARAAVEEARAGRATAFATLTALSGVAALITAIPVSLLAQADMPTSATAIDPLASPAYLAAQADREGATRRVRIERLRRTSDLTVSVGVRRFEQAGGSSALVAGVSAPFPLFDRNQGNIGAADADLAAADARLNAARLDAQAEAQAGLAKLDAAASRRVAARQAEASAQEAYRLTRLGYEGGKLPLSEVLDARRALVAARLQALDAAVGRLRAQAALSRLQGRIPFGDPS